MSYKIINVGFVAVYTERNHENVAWGKKTSSKFTFYTSKSYINKSTISHSNAWRNNYSLVCLYYDSLINDKKSNNSSASTVAPNSKIVQAKKVKCSYA